MMVKVCAFHARREGLVSLLPFLRLLDACGWLGNFPMQETSREYTQVPVSAERIWRANPLSGFLLHDSSIYPTPVPLRPPPTPG